MKSRRTLLWMAAGTIVCVAVLFRDGGDATAPPAARTELFPFVRALPAGDGAQSVPVAEAPAHPAGNAFLAEESVRRMRADGASDDEVYRTRAAMLGAQAANALALLDREEAQWRQRIADYLERRQAVSGDAAAVHALRDSLFTAEELERLAAYEPATVPVQ